MIPTNKLMPLRISHKKKKKSKRRPLVYQYRLMTIFEQWNASN
jgi:hypothetical protein